MLVVLAVLAVPAVLVVAEAASVCTCGRVIT
jgi:hypothetical protein